MGFSKNPFLDPRMTLTNSKLAPFPTDAVVAYLSTHQDDTLASNGI